MNTDYDLVHLNFAFQPGTTQPLSLHPFVPHCLIQRNPSCRVLPQRPSHVHVGGTAVTGGGWGSRGNLNSPAHQPITLDDSSLCPITFYTFHTRRHACLYLTCPLPIHISKRMRCVEQTIRARVDRRNSRSLSGSVHITCVEG